MPKKNAVTPAKPALNRCSSSPHRKHHLDALTAVLSALIVAGSLHTAAMEQSHSFEPAQAEVTVGIASEPDAARRLAGGIIASSSGGLKQVPLFLGYVEFDWDPATPGGIPGFGSWPSTISASHMEN
jgi:hypothetical protein